MDDLPEYLTPGEYAKVMRITRQTVYSLLRSGELPAVRLGQQWRIPNPEFNKAGAGE